MEEKSTFVEFFGDYPLIRVLDFLITYEDFDYNKKDISKNANVAWNTLEIFWNKLIDQNIIIKTRRVGKSDMFKLNKESLVVHELIELDKNLMLESIPKTKENVIIPA